MTLHPFPQLDCPIPRVGHSARIVLVVTALLGLGACATADATLETSMAEKPVVDVIRLVERGDKALEAGAPEAARAHYQLVLQHDLDNSGARLGLAELRLATGDNEAAQDLFLSLESEPGVAARAKQGLGLVHLRQGEREQAKARLQDAASLQPELWRAWNGLGAVHDANGEWGEAMTSYSRAAAAAPNAKSAAIVRNNIGFSLILQGRYSEAVTTLVTAARTDPDLDIARTNLRLALAWQGKYREAVAGALPKERPAVFSNVGYIALLRGDKSDAESLITRAIEESPSHHKAAWLNLQHLKATQDVQDAN